MADSSASCPSDAYFGIVRPIVGSMTFHTLVTIISAACMILSCLVCTGLAIMHLRRYTRSHEQRQIVRIVSTPAMISVFAFFGVWFYKVAGYISPIGEYYESFALVAVFFLFLNYVTPMDYRGSNPFNNLGQIQARYGGASLQVYNKIWVMVLQIIPVRLITTVVGMAVGGSECKLVEHGSKVNTAVRVVSTISTILAFIGILRMTKFLKPGLAGYRPLAKLIGLKMIVGLAVLQTLIFSILNNAHVIHATSTINLPDFLIGLPGLLVCCECFIFSLVFLWAYNAKGYSAYGRDVEQQTGRKIGFFGAILDVLNFSDMVYGLFSCVTAWRTSQSGDVTRMDPAYK